MPAPVTCRLIITRSKIASAPLPWERRTGYSLVQSVLAAVRRPFKPCWVPTAKLNGLNPAEWLKDILEKLPTWPNSRIDELLPLSPEVIEGIKRNRHQGAKW
jgi:hypothetical protein